MTQIASTLLKDICPAMVIPSKESIKLLETAMLAMPNIVNHVDHVFAKGAYLRCISMAKGTLITSKRHKTQHISVVVSGDCTISKEDGTCVRVQGPHVFVTEPNTKRAIIVHEDTVWMTFHVTDKTEVSEIEKDVIQEDV